MGRSFSLKSHLNPAVRPCQDNWCVQMELDEVARSVRSTTHFSEFPFYSFNLLKVSSLGALLV